MKWFLSKIEKLKDAIFINWVGTQPLINVYKPEYLEVRNKEC